MIKNSVDPQLITSGKFSYLDQAINIVAKEIVVCRLYKWQRNLFLVDRYFIFNYIIYNYILYKYTVIKNSIVMMMLFELFFTQKHF